MKRLNKSIIGIALVLCMVQALFGGFAPGVSAAEQITFQPNYGAGNSNTLPADWSSTGNLIKLGSWGDFQNSYSGNDSIIYNKNIWTGDAQFEYSFPQINIFSGSETGMYLFYTDNQNYYSLSFFANRTDFIKCVNGTKTVLGTTGTHMGAEKAIKIIRATNGDFTVLTGTKNTTPTTSLFGTISDTTFTTGKIGLYCSFAGGYYAGIVVKGSLQQAATPTPTPAPTATPGGAAWTNATFQPNYGTADNNTLPVDWTSTGNLIKLGTWGNFQNSYSGNDAIIYNKNIWTGDAQFAYSFSQINIFSGSETGMYLFYTDNKNYYSLSFFADRTDFIKCVNGTKTVLGTTGTHMGAEKAIKITRATNGDFTVLTGTKNTTPTTSLFGAINDTTFTTGKIGLYCSFAGGYYSNIVVSGSIQAAASTPTPAPATATPAPTPLPSPSPGTFIDINPSVAGARYVGRSFPNAGAVQMDFPVTGIEFLVNGATEVQMELKRADTDINRVAYYGVSVDDDQTYTPIALTGTTFRFVKVATLPDNGLHKIRIVKQTGINTSIQIKTIRAIKGGSSLPTLQPTQEKQKKIELVGDSITVGYGLLVDTGKDTTEIGTRTAGSLAAAYFNADVNIPSVSGSSFYKNMETLYGLNPFFFYNYSTGWQKAAAYIWDFNRFTPDVVVVNIGTNDNTNNTVADYVTFAKQIRTKNNDTDKKIKIIFAYGPMTTSYNTIVQSAVSQLNSEGDNNVFTMDYGYPKVTGVDFHPSIAQNVAMEATLIAKIKQLLPEWDEPAYLNVNGTAMDASGLTVNFNSSFATAPSAPVTVTGLLYHENGTLIQVKRMQISDSLSHNLVFDTTGLANGTKCHAKLLIWDSNLKPLSLTSATASLTIAN